MNSLIPNVLPLIIELGESIYNTFRTIWYVFNLTLPNAIEYIEELLSIDLSALEFISNILGSVIPFISKLTLFEIIMGSALVVIVYVQLVSWVIEKAK